MRRVLLSSLVMILFCPSLALAHPGGAAHDAMAGFMHPLTGLDHVLAMLSVGLLAAQRGGRVLWLIPIGFLVMMGLGGALGMAGASLPALEAGIALSVVILGATVASGIAPPAAIGLPLVGLFAVFHGQAHGAEMPQTASAALYGLSFIAATALIHLSGIAFYQALQRRGRSLIRATGGLIAVAGVGLLVGVL